jgi:YD repeat-containing protein
VALLLVVVLGTLLACVAPAAADVFYVYDDLGRLIAVIDPASDTAVYSYDAVGNLLGVTRHSSAQVSIIDFKPKSGPVGTSVAIQGTGFSATASQNTVTFNGTAATVTSATTTELVATVPVGANTGPIGVTAPGGSATSNAAFTVTSTSGAPTITSFTPTIGAPGDAVTVTGTNFDPTLLNNKLGFNATHPRLGRVTAATATALTVTVPPGATSGRLRVATEAGAAESVADFFAPPAPYPAASVVFTGRIAIGGPSLTATIGTAGKIGLVVFDGTVGQRLSLGITNSNFNGGVTVYRPDGTLLMPQGPLDFPPLPVSGTYTIQLGNSFSGTGSLTLTLSEEVTGTITVGGPSVPVSITRPGQRARLTFPGTAGQRLNLRMGSVTI